MSWEESNEISCEGKKTFLTWKQATKHNHSIIKYSSVRAKGKKIDKLHVYKCTKCHLFHLGHQQRQHVTEPFNRQSRRRLLLSEEEE